MRFLSQSRQSPLGMCSELFALHAAMRPCMQGRASALVCVYAELVQKQRTWIIDILPHNMSKTRTNGTWSFCSPCRTSLADQLHKSLSFPPPCSVLHCLPVLAANIRLFWKTRELRITPEAFPADCTLARMCIPGGFLCVTALKSQPHQPRVSPAVEYTLAQCQWRGVLHPRTAVTQRRLWRCLPIKIQ